jgi:hypothetical protein
MSLTVAEERKLKSLEKKARKIASDATVLAREVAVELKKQMRKS